MKCTYTILLIILSQYAVHCQGKEDIHLILQSAFSNTKVDFLSQKTDQLATIDYSIPFLEKIEVRTETNDLDIRKQDLALRFTTNSSTSRKAYRLYHESVQHMSEMEYQAELMNILFDKYLLITKRIFNKELLRIENEKYMVAADKIKLLKRMIALSSFDIVELIEAEDDIYKMQRSIKDLENEIESLDQEIRTILNKKQIGFTRSDILQVSDIKIILDQLILTNKNHPKVETLSAKHYNSMMEHEWESAKSKFSLGFFQVKYGHDPEKLFNNNFSVGFGFDFPWKGSRTLDINEKKIKILDTQSEYISSKEELAQLRKANSTRLKRLIDMHQLLSIQIKEGNAEHALKEYKKQSSASPLALIKLKELNISNKGLLLEIELELITTYIQHLYSEGHIVEKECRNFLDPNLPIIQHNY